MSKIDTKQIIWGLFCIYAKKIQIQNPKHTPTKTTTPLSSRSSGAAAEEGKKP
jgi:hypothetical protein